MQQVQSRKTGYLLNALIGAVSLFTGVSVVAAASSSVAKGAYAAVLAFVLDTGTDIAKGEALARMPAIIPRAGDRLVVDIKFEVNESAHPFGKSALTITSTSKHSRANGDIVPPGSSSGTRKNPVVVKYAARDGFPMEIAHKLFASKGTNRTVKF